MRCRPLSSCHSARDVKSSPATSGARSGNGFRKLARTSRGTFSSLSSSAMLMNLLTQCPAASAQIDQRGTERRNCDADAFKSTRTRSKPCVVPNGTYCNVRVRTVTCQVTILPQVGSGFHRVTWAASLQRNARQSSQSCRKPSPNPLDIPKRRSLSEVLILTAVPLRVALDIRMR